MGIHRLASNRKTTKQRKKNQMTHRRKLKVKREKRGGILVGDIAYPELVTSHILSKRRTSPRANITLSGKKKRKLIKQLKHMAAEKEKEEAAAEDVEMTQTGKDKKAKSKPSEKAAEATDVGDADVEMDDEDEWEDEEVTEVTAEDEQ